MATEDFEGLAELINEDYIDADTRNVVTNVLREAFMIPVPPCPHIECRKYRGCWTSKNWQCLSGLRNHGYEDIV